MEDDFFPKSRSQKKRESTALQDLGAELVKLPESVLNTLNLPVPLINAILEWKRITKHEAKRRQLQFVGRLMRELPDAEALSEAIQEAKGGLNKDNRLMEEIEELRRNILQKNQAARETALQDFCIAYPTADAVRIKRLTTTVLAAQDASDPQGIRSKEYTKAYRELFRCLRTAVEKSLDTASEA